MEYYTLSHHGIKGMRWGIRRFQRKDGSLTRAGQRRLQKQREDALEKARQAKAAKKQHDMDKQTALKSGSASDILKFKGELTKQEMDSAISRIRWEQDMKSIASKEVETGKNKVDKFFSGVDDATTKANTVFKAWNTVANVVNAFTDLDVQLPKIDTNINAGNRTQRQNEKKKLAGSNKNEDEKKKDDDD